MLATAFNAHVVAVDASPETFELAKRNLDAIECALVSNVLLVPLACSDVDARLRARA